MSLRLRRVMAAVIAAAVLATGRPVVAAAPACGPCCEHARVSDAAQPLPPCCSIAPDAPTQPARLTARNAPSEPGDVPASPLTCSVAGSGLRTPVPATSGPPVRLRYHNPVLRI